MIQRLLLLSATLAFLFCESAFGLGLGRLQLNSALNQEFSAEIILTNTGDLAVEEILPSLASQEDFDRVGVDRNYKLTELRFRVIEIENGVKVVRISSRRAIVEPFLNFIVEILWPNGRILREYTVLLDPPVFDQRGQIRIVPGQSSQPSRSAPESGDRSTVAAASAAKKPDQQVTPTKQTLMQEGDTLGDEYGMTGAGDTLWNIAMKVRPDDSVSIQQTMLALQKANPDAFINNNINLLKAGYVLRIPDKNEIRSETRSEAVAEVRIQNQEFQDYRGNRVAQLDATRRTPQSSSTRSSRDDGELKLLASDRSTGRRAGDSDARSEALENELAVVREDLDRAKRANSELNVRLNDLSEQIETMGGLVKLQDEQLAALRANIQKTQELAAKTPVVTTPKPEPTAQVESLLSNPFVLGGLALLIIGGVVGGMIFMRRRQQSSAIDDSDFTEVVLADTQPEEDDLEEEEESDEEEAAEEEEEEELAPQTGDVISEVEIYIAYGRFPQAITFLRNAIDAEPDRADIQLKLLEVYVQTEDATAFNLQLHQLRLLGDEVSIAKAEELQSRIPGASEADTDDAISYEPSTDAEEDEDEDDLSFDLDDLDSETDDDDLDLSDELDLDDDQGRADKLETSEETTDEGEEFDLDLDLDADLDLDFDDETERLDDDSLELDLDDDSLELDLDDDSLELDLDDDSLELDLDDDKLELDLDDDSLELDLDDDNLELDLDDDSLELDLDDDSLEPDLEDDSLEPDLNEDASTKLDLARAYLDMGDTDGVKSLLEDVISEGSDSDIKEANELMQKLN